VKPPCFHIFAGEFPVFSSVAVVLLQGYGGSLWHGAGGCGQGRRGEVSRPEMVMPFVSQGAATCGAWNGGCGAKYYGKPYYS